MKPDLRFIETIDRLIGNIPAACTLLIEEGHVNLAGQLKRDQHNLVHWREQLGDHAYRQAGPLETVTCIPFPVIRFICDILRGTANVEVPWSNDPLDMAYAAIERQQTAISQVLDLMIEHCCFLPAEPEEPEP